MTIIRHLIENPIRGFALLCVAATSGFLAYLLDWRLIPILSSPGWCAKAIQAERITPGTTFQGLTGCIDIMKLQIASLAQVTLIFSLTFALCLGVLVVVVIAGARLVAKLFGNEVGMSRDDGAAAGAQQAADAAQDEADSLKGGGDAA